MRDARWEDPRNGAVTERDRSRLDSVREGRVTIRGSLVVGLLAAVLIVDASPLWAGDVGDHGAAL